jgi:hypothetical protein
MLSMNNSPKTQAGTLTGLAAKLQAKANANGSANGPTVVPAVKPKNGDIDENSIEYVTAVYGTTWATGWQDGKDGTSQRSTHAKYKAGYAEGLKLSAVPVTAKVANSEIDAIKASVPVVPVTRITAPASSEAKAGVSLADTVAKQAKDMEELKAMIFALAQGGGQLQPTATVPTAQAVVAPKTSKPKGFAARKAATSAPATSGTDDGEPRESFDAKTYFVLGDSIASGDDCYVAESSDPKYSKNAIAIVGIQRKTIMLSEAKLEKLYRLMRQFDAYFE